MTSPDRPRQFSAEPAGPAKPYDNLGQPRSRWISDTQLMELLYHFRRTWKPSAFFRLMNFMEPVIGRALVRFGMWRCPRNAKGLLADFDATVGQWMAQREAARGEQVILAALPDGVGYVGRRSAYEATVDAYHKARALRTLTNISGGFAGAAGYLWAGDRGSDIGALVDSASGAANTALNAKYFDHGSTNTAPGKPVPAEIAPARGTANRGVTSTPGTTPGIPPGAPRRGVPRVALPELPTTLPDKSTYVSPRNPFAPGGFAAPRSTPVRPADRGTADRSAPPSARGTAPPSTAPTPVAAPPSGTATGSPPRAPSSAPGTSTAKAPARPRGQGQPADVFEQRARAYIQRFGGRLNDPDLALKETFRRTGDADPHMVQLRSAAVELWYAELFLGPRFKGPFGPDASGRMVRLTVTRLDAIRPRAGGDRVSDFMIHYSDNTREPLEISTVTSTAGVRPGVRATGLDQVTYTLARLAELSDIKARLRDKGIDRPGARSQLALSAARVGASGGTLGIGIVFAGPDVAANCRTAISDVGPQLSPVTRTVIFSFMKVTPRGVPTPREHIVFDRHPDGTYAERR